MSRTILAVVLALAAASAAAADKDTEKKKEPAKPAPPPAAAVVSPALPVAPTSPPRRAVLREVERVVITNEVLEELYGPGSVIPDEPAESAAPPSAEALPDPLQQMQAEQARETARLRAVPEAEKAVADAEAKVKELERRALAVENPFLPPPQVPEEERASWDAMDNVQRLEQTQKEIAQARADLEAAREKLRALKAGGS